MYRWETERTSFRGDKFHKLWQRLIQFDVLRPHLASLVLDRIVANQGRISGTRFGRRRRQLAGACEASVAKAARPQQAD